MITVKNKIQSHLNFYKNNSSSIKTDTVIIGSNLSSYISAYILSKSGEQVTIIEIPENNSAKPVENNSLLSFYEDYYLQDLIQKVGKEKTKEIWEMNVKSLNELEKIIIRENIDCEYERSSAFIYAMDYCMMDKLRLEFETAKELGITGFRFRTIDKIGIGDLAYLEVINQGKLNELKLKNGLKQVCRENNISIIEDDEVLEIEDSNTEGIKITLLNLTLEATNLINNSYTSYSEEYQISDKLICEQTYSIKAKIDSENIADSVFYSPSDPYYNFKVENGYITFSYKPNDKFLTDQQHFESLEECLKNIFTDVKYDIVDQWKQESEKTTDELPFIGKSPIYTNQLIASGLGNNYILNSMMSALLNRDILLGIQNSTEDILNPERALGFIDQINNLTSKGVNWFKSILPSNTIPTQIEMQSKNIADSIIKYNNMRALKKNSILKT